MSYGVEEDHTRNVWKLSKLEGEKKTSLGRGQGLGIVDVDEEEVKERWRVPTRFTLDHSYFKFWLMWVWPAAMGGGLKPVMMIGIRGEVAVMLSLRHGKNLDLELSLSLLFQPPVPRA